MQAAASSVERGETTGKGIRNRGPGRGQGEKDGVAGQWQPYSEGEKAPAGAGKTSAAPPIAMNTFQKCGKKCIQQLAFNEIQMMMGMQKNVEYKRRGAVHTREKTGPLSDFPIWVTICGVVADHRGGKQSL